MSKQLTTARLSELEMSQSTTTPCQEANMKLHFHEFNELKQKISTLDITSDTLPSPQQCTLVQKSFKLLESNDEGGEKLWEVVCAFVVCDADGEPIPVTTGAVPEISLSHVSVDNGNEKEVTISKETEDKEEDVDVRGPGLDNNESTETDDIIADNTTYTMSFASGVWVIVIQTSKISALCVSVKLLGSEIKDSPLTISRGKPELCFGENVGTISSYSHLHPKLFSLMSVEYLRTMDRKPCVWSREKCPYDFMESYVVFELNTSPKCLLSHILLKHATSDQFKLFYRKYSDVESESSSLMSYFTNDVEKKEQGDANSTDIGEENWMLLDALTPDWTDVKQNKTLIIDLDEAVCKSIGYVSAIRLELKAKNKANSCHGINVFGWNINE